jgi:lipoprotein-anchoring transpeptidase ErfK/SrfK
MRRTCLALLGAAMALGFSAPDASAQYRTSTGDRYAAYQPDNRYVAYQPDNRYAAYGTDPLTQQYYEDDSDYFRPQAVAPQRRTVSFPTRFAAGTIVVSTEDRRLYYVTRPGEAIEYAVGVGRPGFEWSGTKTVSMKREWPDWRPPAEMLQRRPDLPRYMPGGPDNPLGARALYLGSSLYRIHGSNEPETIGQAVSSGCIRMTNEDVKDLYSRVKVGAKVVVLR